MQKPPTPPDEARRIAALRASEILDTPAEERFDRLTRLARRLFDVPIALVSLVDENRQWFKSCIGLGASETPRDISFCGHAILDDGTLVVPDTLADARFRDNPLVTGEPYIRFYAGRPLRVTDGSRLGTLCIIDRVPRQLSADELDSLDDLARMAEQELVAVQLATMDEMTLLSNRRGFEVLACQALSLCRRIARPASLLYFDLDGFKSINDRFGHAEGDNALRVFADHLKQTFRESDVIGRLGGDEFAVLMTHGRGNDLEAALERQAESIAAHNRDARCGYDIRYSVGATPFDPARHNDITALLGAADSLMYQHKRAKR